MTPATAFDGVKSITVSAITGTYHVKVDPSSEAFDKLKKAAEQYAFDGVTYDSVKDYSRMHGQLAQVVRLMRDGRWRTLAEIKAATIGSEAGISARLRDIRKPRYAEQFPDVKAVESRRRTTGTWEYRFVVDGKETT